MFGEGASMRLLIEFLISVLSSIGFGVITNIPKRALLPAGITGGVSWCAYWLISLQDHSLILPNFTATVIIGLLGNYFAIRHRVPVGTIPCQVDTYKNENTIFLIRPNRGNIPPRFGHFF